MKSVALMLQRHAAYADMRGLAVYTFEGLGARWADACGYYQSNGEQRGDERERQA
jgi:hypothetical protein